LHFTLASGRLSYWLTLIAVGVVGAIPKQDVVDILVALVVCAAQIGQYHAHQGLIVLHLHHHHHHLRLQLQKLEESWERILQIGHSTTQNHTHTRRSTWHQFLPGMTLFTLALLTFALLQARPCHIGHNLLLDHAQAALSLKS